MNPYHFLRRNIGTLRNNAEIETKLVVITDWNFHQLVNSTLAAFRFGEPRKIGSILLLNQPTMSSIGAPASTTRTGS